MFDKLRKGWKALKKLSVPYKEICNSVSQEKLQEWQLLVDRWQEDHDSKPNPYQDDWEGAFCWEHQLPVAHIVYLAKGGTLADLQRELAVQEAEELRLGIEVGNDVPPSDFVLQGIELEEAQYVYS